MSRTGDNDYPHVVRRLERVSEERGQKELDEKGVAEMIDSKLHIVTVCGQTGRNRADGAVADEEVESSRQSSETRDGFANRSK